MMESLADPPKYEEVDVYNRIHNNTEVLSRLMSRAPNCNATRMSFLVSRICGAIAKGEVIPSDAMELKQAVWSDASVELRDVALSYMGKNVLLMAERFIPKGSAYPDGEIVDYGTRLFAQDRNGRRFSSSARANIRRPNERSPSPALSANNKERSELTVRFGDEAEYDEEEMMMDIRMATKVDALTLMSSTSLPPLPPSKRNSVRPIRTDDDPLSKKYPCPHCGKVCENQHAYASHIRHLHRDQSRNSLAGGSNGGSGANGGTTNNGSSASRSNGTNKHTTAAVAGEEVPRRPYDCPHCGLKCPSQQSYASHIRYTHPKDPSAINTPPAPRRKDSGSKKPGESVYRCRRCNNVFDTAQGIAGHTRHCMLVNPNPDEANGGGSTVNGSGRKRRTEDDGTLNQGDRSAQFAERGLDSKIAKTCPYCGLLLHSIHAVDKHVRHTHESMRAECYRCSQCMRRFMTLGGLENHWLYYNKDCPGGKLEISHPPNSSMALSANIDNVQVEAKDEEEDDELDEVEEELEEEEEEEKPKFTAPKVNMRRCGKCSFASLTAEDMLDHMEQRHTGSKRLKRAPSDDETVGEDEF